jgi:hypothetical protein
MKLKNYKPYLRQIKRYAKLCNVEIVFKKEVDGVGEYVPNRRRVALEKGLDQSAIISTLLHELGHFIDDFRNPENNLNNKFHNDGRTAIEREREMTSQQKKKILKIEREAWKNGRALARQLNIPLGSWFYRDEKSSLNSYYAMRTRD